MIDTQFKPPNSIIHTVIFTLRRLLDFLRLFSNEIFIGEVEERWLTKDLTEKALLASKDHDPLSGDLEIYPHQQAQ